MRQILDHFLTAQGWILKDITRADQPFEVEAQQGNNKWIIQIKNSSYQLQDPVTAFVSVLGEILQRMDNPNTKYSIALPDTDPFCRLWKRLPELPKQKTGITALFVNPLGFVREEYI